MKTVIKNADDKMTKSVSHLETEFSEIRAGRANPSVLDKVRVDYYGTPTPVNQVAAVSVTEARTLIIPFFIPLHAPFPVLSHRLRGTCSWHPPCKVQVPQP